MPRVTVPSDNPERRAAGVTYQVVYDDPEEQDSCTCASWKKIRAKSGAWQDCHCRHLRPIIRAKYDQAARDLATGQAGVATPL